MILNVLNNLISLLCGIGAGVYYFLNNQTLSALNIIKGIGLALAALVGGYIAFLILIWIFFIGVAFFIKPNKDYEKPSKFFNAVFVFWYSYINNFFRVKIKVTGLEKVPFGTRFLAIANHRSNLDNMIQALVLKKEQIAYISKPENFKFILCRAYMKRGLYLSIERGDVKKALRTILKAISYIKENVVSVGVFPEGRRSKTGELLDFKPGCFKIAEKTGCPIVVCTLDGTEKVHKNFPWKKTVVNFDVIKVFNYEEYKDLPTVEISERIRKLMLEKLGK